MSSLNILTIRVDQVQSSSQQNQRFFFVVLKYLFRGHYIIGLMLSIWKSKRHHLPPHACPNVSRARLSGSVFLVVSVVGRFKQSGVISEAGRNAGWWSYVFFCRLRVFFDGSGGDVNVHWWTREKNCARVVCAVCLEHIQWANMASRKQSYADALSLDYIRRRIGRRS